MSTATGRGADRTAQHGAPSGIEGITCYLLTCLERSHSDFAPDSQVQIVGTQALTTNADHSRGTNSIRAELTAVSARLSTLAT
jgi:hypothetical protein